MKLFTCFALLLILQVQDTLVNAAATESDAATEVETEVGLNRVCMAHDCLPRILKERFCDLVDNTLPSQLGVTRQCLSTCKSEIKRHCEIQANGNQSNQNAAGNGSNDSNNNDSGNQSGDASNGGTGGNTGSGGNTGKVKKKEEVAAETGVETEVGFGSDGCTAKAWGCVGKILDDRSCDRVDTATNSELGVYINCLQRCKNDIKFYCALQAYYDESRYLPGHHGPPRHDGPPHKSRDAQEIFQNGGMLNPYERQKWDKILGIDIEDHSDESDHRDRPYLYKGHYMAETGVETEVGFGSANSEISVGQGLQWHRNQKSAIINKNYHILAVGAVAFVGLAFVAWKMTFKNGDSYQILEDEIIEI